MVNHMTLDDIESALDIIDDNGGTGEWESAPLDTTDRWLFPRFEGADKIGKCSTKAHAAKGNHAESKPCKDWSVDQANMYLSRSGVGPYDTDVETLCAWLDAPRNIVGGVMLLGSPGTGKLLPLETPIPTPTGWTTMGELEQGDLVLGRDGKPTRVVFTSTVEQTPDLYDVHLSDGSVVTACADHQWVVSNKRDRATGREQVLTTSAIKAAGLYGSDLRCNWAIRVAAPLNLRKKNLPLDPYVLGVWLGDGATHRNGGAITSMDEQIIKAVVEAGFPISSSHKQATNRATTYRFEGLGAALYAAGVGNGKEPKSSIHMGWRYGSIPATEANFGKHIPLAYLRASYEQRLALLQGIMDTDGTVSRNGQCEVALSDERLARDVLDLIHTLGIKAKITTEPSFYRDEEGELVQCKERHRIHFTTTQQVFRLDRKMTRLPEKIRSTNQWLYIEKIVPVETRPGKCIQVDNEDSTYLCTENYIPTHNTALAQAAATHGGWNFRVITATPDHTKDSLLIRFMGEGKGLNGTAFGLGPLAQAVADAAERKTVLCIDEFMLFVDGVKPVFYPLLDGNHWLPEANIDGSAMPIPDNFRVIVTSNPQVRGASLPEPIASRFASTTLTVETSASMLRDLAIDDAIVAAWEALGTQGLWRPQIREIRLADYWLSVDMAQAVSAFVPEHCPESQRKAVRDTVVGYLGGNIREDGRLVVA